MIIFPEPPYMAELPEEQRQEARARFLIRLAALYFSPEGKMQALSSACGLHKNHLATLRGISPESAIKMEKAVGRELFPRELFRPDLFTVQQ